MPTPQQPTQESNPGPSDHESHTIYMSPPSEDTDTEEWQQLWIIYRIFSDSFNMSASQPDTWGLNLKWYHMTVMWSNQMSSELTSDIMWLFQLAADTSQSGQISCRYDSTDQGTLSIPITGGEVLPIWTSVGMLAVIHLESAKSFCTLHVYLTPTWYFVP